jgi:hypothetical protein
MCGIVTCKFFRGGYILQVLQVVTGVYRFTGRVRGMGENLRDYYRSYRCLHVRSVINDSINEWMRKRLAMSCWWTRIFGEMCGLWRGFMIVGCWCVMGRQLRYFKNLDRICGGWRHPPHPTAGGGTLPGPLESNS